MLRDLLAQYRIPIPLQSLCANGEKALCKTPGTECGTPNMENMQSKHPVQDNGRGGDAPLNTAVA